VLQKGEQVGITGYEKIVDDPVLAEFKDTITLLLERCRSHHARLQELRDHILETPTRPMTAW
jgi:hypothetical protein